MELMSIFALQRLKHSPRNGPRKTSSIARYVETIENLIVQLTRRLHRKYLDEMLSSKQWLSLGKALTDEDRKGLCATWGRLEGA